MLKILKIGLYCIGIIMLNVLGACQEEKTVAKSKQSEQQTVQDQSLLKRLSGRIVFQSDRDGDWDIYVMNIDGSNLVQLTDDPAADEYPVWSPDGTQIAFYSDRDGNCNIYLMNADGSNQRRITDHPAHDRNPTWSPDGKQIAFDSERNNDLEIYIMNLDGSGLSQLTDKIGKDILPDWSPDGKRIVYTGNRYLGWNVYIMNIDKTQDKRITDGHGACRPDWSPDGKKIAYVSQQADGKGDIWIMNPDGNEKTRVTFDDKNYDYHPAWSPDGKYIAYAKTSDKNTGNWELYVISADGTEQARLTNHPARDSFPDWSNGRVPDELFLRQKFVYEAESSPRQIGTQQDDPEASGGQTVYAGKSDQAGFLVYGPYKSYAPSDYVASFRLKTDHIKLKEPIVAIDVVTDTGQIVLMKSELKGTDFPKDNLYQEFQLSFSLKESKTLEFRVYSFARANIWVDKVTVTRKPN
jgi:Tol biopolymer transport system component